MRTPALLLAATLLACSGCDDSKPKAAAPAAPAAAPAKRVSVLVTGHESGHLVTAAPRLSAQWKARERWPDAIALSTGDAFAGLAISSHFEGLPTAEVMKALQYKASAVGNHDFDLGLETLQKFRAASGVAYLAANLQDRPASPAPLKLDPFVVIEREGVKVGVVGLTSEKTIATTGAGRTSALQLVPTEQALPPALEGVRKAGADVVVVIIDDCFASLAKNFEVHPEWSADLVVGSRCDGANEAKVRDVAFYSTGDDVSHYVAATIELPAGGKRSLKVARVELAPKGPEDGDLLALRDRWQAKLDTDLGEVVAFSKAGVAQDSALLRTWVAAALKDETKSDAALVNRKGIRDALPKGNVTKAHVYSMIPFENAVLTVKVKGEQLEKLAANPEAVLVLPPGKLDKAREYQLATTDYLYFGGDGLGLEAVAPEPELTGQVWQTPVISWLKARGTSAKKPLESLK